MLPDEISEWYSVYIMYCDIVRHCHLCHLIMTSMFFMYSSYTKNVTWLTVSS